MVGEDYPISFDGKQIGFGRVLSTKNFDLVLEVDKDAEKFYNENFSIEERMSFSFELK